MSKVVACVIARTVSTRLPLKILRDLAPRLSMIEYLISRLKTVNEIDEIYICTSTESVDDILEDIAIRNNVKLYRGSADEVIQRMVAVGELEKADVVLRITGDNPLSSIEYLPQQIKLLHQHQLDYVRVVDVPIGATIEVISYLALVDCYNKMDKSVSEYLMLFLFEPNNYKCGIIKAFKEDYSHYSVTVDTPDDLIRVKNLIKTINPTNPTNIHLDQIIAEFNKPKTELIYPKKSFTLSGMVKMPYNKEVSFADFHTDMARRKSLSTLLTLSHE